MHKSDYIRKKYKLWSALASHGVSATLYDLSGGCVGVWCKDTTQYAKASQIASNHGMAIIRPHEYQYSHGDIAPTPIIIY